MLMNSIMNKLKTKALLPPPKKAGEGGKKKTCLSSTFTKIFLVFYLIGMFKPFQKLIPVIIFLLFSLYYVIKEYITLAVNLL